MPTLAAVKHHLHTVLGIAVSSQRPWARLDELPYFLRDAFDYWEMELLGRPVLLVVEHGADHTSVGGIRQRLQQLARLDAPPAIYVTGALASHERKRLIDQKIPFIVPGNQLYLPDLGIDLREHFRQRSNPPAARLSPSAQALLLAALLRPEWEPDWHPSEVAIALGYSTMTLSRAIRELAASGVASARKAGKSHYLNMHFPARETWERFSPILRSPIQKTIWLEREAMAELPCRLAGLSALAQQSMLIEPKQAVYAVHRSHWNGYPAPVDHSAPSTGELECQLWNYTPALLPDMETVDPLSLILSLRDNADDRVQGALDELMGQLPWSGDSTASAPGSPGTPISTY